MPGDADRPTRVPGELVRMLERAIAVAKRRRQYRLGLALIGLATLTTLVVTGVLLLLQD